MQWDRTGKRLEKLKLTYKEEVLLGVHTHEEDALARVDPQAAEAADRGLENHFAEPAGRAEVWAWGTCTA